MGQINRWPRFVRVNDPVRNLWRVRVAAVNIEVWINLADPCGDSNSDVETCKNI